jgi:hypothetical protein
LRACFPVHRHHGRTYRSRAGAASRPEPEPLFSNGG